MTHLTKGDRVVVVKPGVGNRVERGDLGTVTEGASTASALVYVDIDGKGERWVYPERLAKAFTRGDRVRVKDTATFTRTGGEVVPSSWRGREGVFDRYAYGDKAVFDGKLVDLDGLEPVQDAEPVFAIGDKAVVGTAPYYRIGSTVFPISSLREGTVVTVTDDGDADGDIEVKVETGGRRTRLAPASLAPYVAPVTNLDRLMALPPVEEPDEMTRRANALEAALDVLGDDRTVEEYVLAARFLLGEEVTA